jgi:hypothetical protein
MRLARGHVVALRRQGAGIVWHVNASHLWVLPVGGCNGPPRHRADIRIHDPADAVDMGLSFKFPVVRCHTLLKIERSDIVGIVPIGQTPLVLMSEITRAAQREATAQTYEARMVFMRPRPAASVAVL